MKLRNKLLIGVLTVLFAVGGMSCKKYLDINTSPLTATKVDAGLLFGYAITAWDVNKNGGDTWLPIGLFVQNIASGGDYGWEKGNLYDVSVYSIQNSWTVYYSTGGNNLESAIRNAENADPVDNNTAAQCKIVKALMMYEATTLFGDVPFTEAWKPEEFPYPQFDAQKDVFEGIIALLDEAVAQMDPSSPLRITDYDVFYKGDLAKWAKLANSIKFKVLMTMVDKDPSKAAAIGEMLNNPASMLSSAADDMTYKYYDKSDNENPKYRLFKEYTGGKNYWFFANNNVFKFMEPKNDPRIPQYFDLGLGDDVTTYEGVDTEVDADDNTSLLSSSYLYRKDAPSLILSYQEILMLQAEAYARGLGVAANLATANDLFRKGVKASMDFYEADPAAIQVYLDTQLPNLVTTADPVKEIHIQQWIDLMDRPLEAFVQWRRSGSEGNEVPALTLPPGATAGPLIRRFVLPPNEISSNPNVPDPQPKYYDKMWFDL